jgi:hypothetical protein
MSFFHTLDAFGIPVEMDKNIFFTTHKPLDYIKTRNWGEMQAEAKQKDRQTSLFGNESHSIGWLSTQSQ